MMPHQTPGRIGASIPFRSPGERLVRAGGSCQPAVGRWLASLASAATAVAAEMHAATASSSSEPCMVRVEVGSFRGDQDG